MNKINIHSHAVKVDREGKCLTAAQHRQQSQNFNPPAICQKCTGSCSVNDGEWYQGPWRAHVEWRGLAYQAMHFKAYHSFVKPTIVGSQQVYSTRKGRLQRQAWQSIYIHQITNQCWEEYPYIGAM